MTFLSLSLSLCVLSIIVAVNLVGIHPPASEKWCRAHSSQTPTQQVGPIDDVFRLRGRKFLLLYLLCIYVCLSVGAFIQLLMLQSVWYVIISTCSHLTVLSLLQERRSRKWWVLKFWWILFHICKLLLVTGQKNNPLHHNGGGWDLCEEQNS